MEWGQGRAKEEDILEDLRLHLGHIPMLIWIPVAVILALALALAPSKAGRIQRTDPQVIRLYLALTSSDGGELTFAL